MNKKQIMEMNDKWKNFRLQESAKLFQTGAQHGFDLSDFKPGGFKRFLKALGIPAIAKGSFTGASWSDGKPYYWRNKDIVIITANNPITGQYHAPDRRNPEDMENVVKLFKKHTSYSKGESKGRRDFV